MVEVLSKSDRAVALARLKDWRETNRGKAITKTFVFDDFSAAFGFMARVALAAEKMDHHPDWSNSYNKVAATLSTHSAGGVTSSDILLAEAMDEISNQQSVISHQ
jgi:4a-hydroxytetrahydrobiopterin dehydratase